MSNKYPHLLSPVKIGYVVFKNLEAGDIIQIEGNSKANMNSELTGQMFHIAAISHDFPVYKAKMEFIHPTDVDLNYKCYRLDCEPEVKTIDKYGRTGKNNKYIRRKCKLCFTVKLREYSKKYYNKNKEKVIKRIKRNYHFP